MLGVVVVKEKLIGFSGMKIILFLVKVAFHHEGNFGRCLEMRFSEIPGHDVKWPWLMATIKVNVTGMKAAVWKYLTSSRLVDS